MRLFYSPDAPKNYQPKFFRNVPKKAEEFVAAEPFVTKVGSVSTPYYTLDLNMVSATDEIPRPFETTKENESETEDETQDTTPFEEYYNVVKNAILSGKIEKSRAAVSVAFYSIPPNIFEGCFFIAFN